MTAVLHEFQVGDRAYQTAARASDDCEAARIKVEWPTWCQRMGLARQITPTEFEVPPLVGFRREGAMEVWRIALPGRFGDPGERSPREMLPGFLASSRAGAVTAHGVEVDPGVLEVVVSYWALPDELGFDPGKIPAEVHRVWVGQLLDGSDGIWDVIQENFGLVVGQVGSGKSKTAEMLLVQFAVKGWHLIICTPKHRDPILTGFDHHPHTVITGITDETLEQIVEMFRTARADRTKRQEIQAEYGVEWWHHVPPHELALRPMTKLVFDESRSYFLSHKGESDHRRKLKAEILHSWNEWVQEGRSAGHHGLIVSQSVAVDGLGGGFVDEQLGMRLAVRRLNRKWHPVMFPETPSDAPSLLVNAATPPGRAVARGLVAPDTVFGAEAVNDAPMQIPLMDKTTRTGLLDGTIPWGPDATTETADGPRLEAVPPDPGPAIEPGSKTTLATLVAVVTVWLALVVLVVVVVARGLTS